MLQQQLHNLIPFGLRRCPTHPNAIQPLEEVFGLDRCAR
jgi:hypothetical protein